MRNKRIVYNAIRTPDGTVIESTDRHDYVTHIDANGKEYMVDGGHEYLRRNMVTDQEELSLYETDPFEEIRKDHKRGGRGVDGTEPLKWVPLYKMNNEWLRACVSYNDDRGLGSSLSTDLYKQELAYRVTHNINII